MKHVAALFTALFFVVTAAWAHDIPSSRIDMRVSSAGAITTLDAPVSGWAHDFAGLTPQDAVGRQTEIETLALSRLTLIADEKTLAVSSGGAARLLPKSGGETPLRLSLSAPLPASTKILTVRGRLFPTDPKHQTVLVVRGAEGQLLHEAILTPDAPEAIVQLGDTPAQNPFAVFAQFVQQGVYHIAIGPDHILFVVALLLMGGTLGQLLKVITAFTVAHSITLVLASLGIVNLPGAFVEPAIAASIVFVGVRVLQTKWRSPEAGESPKGEERLPYAFGFGLIHGFGFAGALAELELPRQALALSLFGFNLGVEVGQAILVLCIAPLLALLHRKFPVAAHRLVLIVAGIVIAAGAYWFGERIAG
ncbi:MAG: HupE/UreJ family protein [Akkermansiaceae bacterium]|nr:HupE/UreJ family protein [Armatimonadota bacterium]